MTNTFTLAELLAMSNDDLNALAAELRGLKRIGGDNGGGDWVDEFDDFYDEIFIPATDRNQSGELLAYAASQGAPVEIFFTGRTQRSGFVKISGAAAKPFPVKVEGNDARAETIAFIAAMLAMAGRLQ